MSRVALIGENSIGYISTLIDIWNNGDCAVLLDWRIPSTTATEMMIEAGVHTCFIEKKLFDKNEMNFPNSIDFITYEKQNESAEQLPKFIYDKFQENYSREEAVVIYSSGTTGKSKGIILSHFAINTNADAIIDYMKPTAEDCIYIAKTLSHSSTLTGELLVALKTKIGLVIAPTIVPPRYVLNNISKYNVTTICLNPTLLLMFSDEFQRRKYNLSSLNTIYVSGSILSDKIYSKAHATFFDIPVYNVYGLSEAGPRVTAQRASCCRNNSVGQPIKGVEVAIINEQGDSAATGEYGTIHVKTPSMFDGYIIGEQIHANLQEGWYNTGDIGYIDGNNELHIVSRLDDVIIIDSHKVYPSEIEDKIVAQTSVKECVVTEIEIGNTITICCLYVGNEDASNVIKEELRKILMPYEIPRYFVCCDVLPRTRNEKISMSDVRMHLKKRI